MKRLKTLLSVRDNEHARTASTALHLFAHFTTNVSADQRGRQLALALGADLGPQIPFHHEGPALAREWANRFRRDELSAVLAMDHPTRLLYVDVMAQYAIEVLRNQPIN